MKSCLDDLKTQSAQSFSFLSHAKESLNNVHELRETVMKGLKDIEPLLGEQGLGFKATEMRNIVNEFELECVNCKTVPLFPLLGVQTLDANERAAHQVADLLRDKLKSAGDDLIDARNRVAELEQSQAADRETIRSLSNNHCNSSTYFNLLFVLLRCLTG